MGFRGGGQIDPPPQRILVFKYPSGDRVKKLEFKKSRWKCQNSKSTKNIKFIKLYLTALYIKSIIRPSYSFDMKANKQSLKLI